MHRLRVINEYLFERTRGVRAAPYSCVAGSKHGAPDKGGELALVGTAQLAAPIVPKA